VSLEKLPSKLVKSETANLTGEISSFLKLNGYLESLYEAPYLFEMKVVHQPEQQALRNGNGPPDDYYVNFGKAIETIKEDFPQLFVRDFDYSIFRDDLVFRDPVNTFQGIRFYKYMLLSLRWHGRIFFKRTFVRIHNLWPRPEGTIRVRWSIHAVPRIPWEAESIFDGVSEYKLDRHGKVYEHAVDNMIFRDPPVFRLPVLFAQLNPVTQRNPIPSAWCRLHQSDGCFFVHRFSWVRMYFILSVVMSVLKAHRYDLSTN